MRRFILFLLFLTLSLPCFYAQAITIGSTGDYPNLEAAASVITAGDTLLLQPQVFADGTQFLYDINGTASAPVVILAEIEHQSIFRGGTEGIHLVNCSHVQINGIVVEQQTGNGINVDDGSDYTTPSKHITIRNCIFRDMAANGNNDLLKMSGVDSFLIENCEFINGGSGGSGVDFVGCHWGTVQDCYFDEPGVSGIQNKGGSQHIRIQRNIFKDVAQRALNLGGSTGLQYFRPPLPDTIVDAFEAADLEVFSNVFINSWAPVAYVGCVRVKVYNNTFYHPENWVIRILQETTTTGFLPCSDNEFRNNIIYLADDLTEVNIGPNTEPQTFIFSNNLWFNASSSNWSPVLPVVDVDQVIADPLFVDPVNEIFHIPPTSPAVGAGFVFDEPATDFDQDSFLVPPSCGAYEGGVHSGDVVIEVQDDYIQVFPNPTTSTVEVDGSFSNVNIKILNASGQEVQDYSNVSPPLIIDINDLPQGMHFILIESVLHNSLVLKKIIKN